jgi:hypothetical protein
MKNSLVQGLKEKDMQAVVNTYNLNDFFYPSIFPLKFTPTLTWKSLEADLGLPIAADVVSYDATAPRKTRRVINRLSGDIPKIEIARDKKESELNEYYELLNYAKTTDGAQAILDWIYEDVEFCFKGVNARLEWLALRALSTGKVTLDKDNNNGVVTETAIDFMVPTAQKSGVTTIWSTAASADPVANIKAKQKLAKAAGWRLGVAYMDQDTFDYMVATEKVQKAMASWAIVAVSGQSAPDLETVNKYMAKNGLPRIIIIDSQMQIEKQDGTKTTVTPFQAGVVALVPEAVCGNTYHGPLADEKVESSTALKVKRGHVMIKRFSQEEPLVESTKAMANAFPVFASAKRAYLMDALNTSWTY